MSKDWIVLTSRSGLSATFKLNTSALSECIRTDTPSLA